ncbi:MAG: RNA methyltransferase [Clostridiales bacterium]|nr:RNA methyltransferase [Clostridiales bacterium]
MNIITSKNNPIIKSATKLQVLKYRNFEKAFLIESEKVIEMAIASVYSVQRIFFDAQKQEKFSALLHDAEQKNIQTIAVNDEVMKKLSSSKSPQGIVAVVEYMEFDTKDIEGQLIVACDALSDPGNLGTIIRTADAVGAGAVLLSNDCVDVYNDKVIRASMGSIFNIRVVMVDSLEYSISDLQKLGYKAGCGHLDGDNFFERAAQEKTILVIGNEAKGVSDDIACVCDYQWKLPMVGKAESFNVAVAAGIMMYDIVKENKKN